MLGGLVIWRLGASVARDGLDAWRFWGALGTSWDVLKVLLWHSWGTAGDS